MSRENVELVKNAWRGWDERGLDGFLEFFTEDVEYLPVEESRVVRGRDGMRRHLESWLEAWDEWQMQATEFRESGEDVFVAIAVNGRGRGSGVEIAMGLWEVIRFRDGRALRIEEYTDRAEALEAVGLRA